MINFIFEKSDIHRIGHTGINEGGNTAILCNLDTANIEEILLRNILKCFGENYKIVERLDYPQTADIEQVEAIEFITNLPFEFYSQTGFEMLNN